MADPEDVVQIEGVHLPRPLRAGAGDTGHAAQRGPRRRWKSIWFQCCHVYGRIYRNREATRYEGQCPRCGGRVYAIIGPGGTSQRIFRAV